MAVGPVDHNSGNIWPTTLLVPMADITNQPTIFLFSAFFSLHGPRVDITTVHQLPC